MYAYQRAYNILRERIVSRTIPAGARLAPEHELAGEFGVSRITIRHALKLLQDQGLIDRTAGRGTFVLGSPERKLAIVNTDFVGSIRKQAPQMTRRLLSHTTLVPPPHIAEALGLLKGERCVLAVRADLLRKRPLAYDQAYIPLSFAGSLDKPLLERIDFLDHWLRITGLKMSCISETVEAVGADRTMAKRLRVKAGAPILVSTEIVYDEQGTALIGFLSYYRGDRFKRISTNRMTSP
jgi:GntR family transcriptional regulator